MPNSRATCTWDLPLRWTNCTASSLNSLVKIRCSFGMLPSLWRLSSKFISSAKAGQDQVSLEEKGGACRFHYLTLQTTSRKGVDMSTLRRVEAACWVVAALFGLLDVASVLFGPTYSFASSSVGGAEQRGTANVWQVGIESI